VTKISQESIYQLLKKEDKELTAEEIKSLLELEGKSMSEGTLYQNLRKLEKNNDIKKTKYTFHIKRWKVVQ
jgi:Fe2+ or Zn2+ uptake regulation protein|tara:strand:- start:2097 stop:2309 length:213 start_codon:yes stop_codon:yes gene_type:complete